MWFEACCTLHGGPACSRRALLWTGVTGGPSPDRMHLSMDQYNLQVRKSSLWISGPCLDNQQRGSMLGIRDVFCAILALLRMNAWHMRLHQWCAQLCRAAEAFNVALGLPQTSLGTVVKRERLLLPWDQLAGLCQSHTAGEGHSSLLSSGP